jgi:cytochrome c-type biogenesis protein CcmH
MTRRALALLGALLALTLLGAPLALLGAPLALAASTPVPAAAAPAPKTSVDDIEDEVMCVACGVPLQIADSPQADRERAYIRQLVAKGLTKDQVKDALIATYTPRVLAMPQKHGFGLVAFIVPIVVVIAALIALAIGLPRWRRRKRDNANGPTDDGPTLSDTDARRLDEDLASYKL